MRTRCSPGCDAVIISGRNAGRIVHVHSIDAGLSALEGEPVWNVSMMFGPAPRRDGRCTTDGSAHDRRLAPLPPRRDVLEHDRPRELAEGW